MTTQVVWPKLAARVETESSSSYVETEGLEGHR